MAKSSIHWAVLLSIHTAQALHTMIISAINGFGGMGQSVAQYEAKVDAYYDNT